ncbi:MAG: Lrp/AsnC family transcriptional regulator [Candidatus Aenigmarchaeota archaeon]|nr:Lrp/AsnC family transcriptional regulator [Candidatus Aenigmarchaeota archaeon]
MPDKTDLKVLKILMGNARLSYRQMARKAGISTATVISRIRSMQDQGILKGFTAMLDYEKLGYGMQVAIEIRVSRGRLIEVEKQIAESSNVFAVYDITGGFDAMVLAKFRDTRQLDSFIKRLQTIPHVERTHTKLILNVIKEEGMRF